MKNVNIADLIKINIYQSRSAFDVQIECLEKNKNVVFDEKALRTLNEQLTERCKGLSVGDPKTHKYIEEFVYRMISELHRNGLVELEEAQEPDSDPYKKVRSKYAKF
jgi:hypothetical protein